MSDALADLMRLEDCWCHSCAATIGKEQRLMVLCPDCGCKRCPKAAHHEHACTRSNDSSQVGSVYGEMCQRECCREYRESAERLN